MSDENQSIEIPMKALADAHEFHHGLMVMGDTYFFNDREAHYGHAVWKAALAADKQGSQKAKEEASPVRYIKGRVDLDDPETRNLLQVAGWTPPDEVGLTQECRRCLSVAGLKEFIAKHHPDYVLESRKQNPAEWLRLDECDVQFFTERDEYVLNLDWSVNSEPSNSMKMIRYLASHGPAAVRVRRKG